MLTHTRQTVYYGVGCIFSPQPVLDHPHALQFQKELAAHGLTFTQAQLPPNGLILSRDAKPVELRVQQLGPAVGTIVLVAPVPWASLDEFIDEARTAFQAYTATWPGQPLQVIQRECTMKQLYDVADEHSFKFLWETRLGCKQEELNVFGRAVLGGGIRLVVPPSGPQVDEPNADLKIESYFQDPKKLFVEVTMKWMVPQVHETLDPEPMMRETDRFLADEVVAFISGAER